MVKKFLMVCAVSFTAVLGGCASTGGTSTQADIAVLIAQVQAYSKAACGFIPTASTIVNLLSGGNANVSAALSIAQAICAAVAPPAAMSAPSLQAAGPRIVNGFRVTPGAVNGVAIKGRRV